MKKILLFLAVVVICSALAASGTIAYFTYEDTAHNVITTGDVSICIDEWTEDENGELKPFPEEGITGQYPGSDASKIVRVINDGEQTAWVRAWLEYTIVDEKSEPLSLVVENRPDVPIMTFEILDGWVYAEEEDMYYYTKPLEAGQETGSLFEKVHFSVLMGNAYQNCTANIVIHAQAVQAVNNADNVLEVQGWPDAERE